MLRRQRKQLESGETRFLSNGLPSEVWPLLRNFLQLFDYLGWMWTLFKKDENEGVLWRNSSVWLEYKLIREAGRRSKSITIRSRQHNETNRRATNEKHFETDFLTVCEMARCKGWQCFLEVREENRCCRATDFKDLPCWHCVWEWTVYPWRLITWKNRSS